MKPPAADCLWLLRPLAHLTEKGSTESACDSKRSCCYCRLEEKVEVGNGTRAQGHAKAPNDLRKYSLENYIINRRCVC